MRMRRSLIIYAVVSCGLAFTLNSTERQAGYFALNSANAEEGKGDDSGEGGKADPAPTEKKITQNNFRGMSKSQLIDLEEQNARKDTQIVIEGFPTWFSDSLISAAAIDRRTIKKLMQALSSVSDNLKRIDIIKEALKKLETRVKLLKTDIRTTKAKRNKEWIRIRENFPVGKIHESELYKSLSKELEQEQLRLRAAEKVEATLNYWLINPGFGKITK